MNLLVAIPPCRDQIPYLWLTGWQYHDHNTLWRFYKCPSETGSTANV